MVTWPTVAKGLLPFLPNGIQASVQTAHLSARSSRHAFLDRLGPHDSLGVFPQQRRLVHGLLARRVFTPNLDHHRRLHQVIDQVLRAALEREPPLVVEVWVGRARHLLRAEACLDIHGELAVQRFLSGYKRDSIHFTAVSMHVLSPGQTVLPTRAKLSTWFKLGIVCPPTWLELDRVGLNLIKFKFSPNSSQVSFRPFRHPGQLEPTLAKLLCYWLGACAVVFRQDPSLIS